MTPLSPLEQVALSGSNSEESKKWNPDVDSEIFIVFIGQGQTVTSGAVANCFTSVLLLFFVLFCFGTRSESVAQSGLEIPTEPRLDLSSGQSPLPQTSKSWSHRYELSLPATIAF